MRQRAHSPEYYRDAAERFRLLADIEPWPALRRHFRRNSAQYEQWAAELDVEPAEPED